MQEQLQELIKVGVGGKFRDSNDYLKKVEEELKHEEAMMRGGIERYNHLMQSAQNKGQESTTMYGLYTQQKYIGKLSFLIHAKIKKIETGQVGVHQVAIKKISQCLPKTAFYSDTRKLRDDQSIWERKPLETLAKNKQLSAFKHEGFWKPMDTIRDKMDLEDLIKSKSAPWIKW